MSSTHILSLLQGDIIIDGGNSNHQDTTRRVKALSAKGFHFVGAGVSGGEEGALHGPSIMPGGSKEAWPHIKDIFQVSCQISVIHELLFLFLFFLFVHWRRWPNQTILGILISRVNWQKIAAKVEDGSPCCDWVGEEGAGHFVKMVHNGIEYGDMQLIAEVSRAKSFILLLLLLHFFPKMDSIVTQRKFTLNVFFGSVMTGILFVEKFFGNEQ
jgi:6-phosphogluconate dehydrogenase